jgi:hypothetical protein
MTYGPEDGFGVPRDWDRRSGVNVYELSSELLEHLNVAWPEEITYEGHRAFLDAAIPLVEAIPDGITDAIHLFHEGEFAWPWTASPDEQYEELPGSVYDTFLRMRSAVDLKEYQDGWDMLLDIMEDFCEWAAR